MTIYIHLKKLGKKPRPIEACAYELQRCPETLRELICELVQKCVEDYHSRMGQEPAAALTGETLAGMAQVGRIGFGVSYSAKRADLNDAIETALTGFADGLYRFFLNDSEVTALDAPLTLRENDTITMIRLVMLTGGMF